jgi:hypothetical protein
MKKEASLKLKKGGLDTIVAYIVVMLPLFYVLVYMIATIYHFSVQQYMNQVVKEACVMASTYGAITEGHENYIYSKLAKALDDDKDGKADVTITYYRRPFDESTGVVGNISDGSSARPGVNKGDIIGIYVQSKKPSLLGTVGNFNVFMFGRGNDNLLKYTAYREEIIRNEHP